MPHTATVRVAARALLWLLRAALALLVIDGLAIAWLLGVLDNPAVRAQALGAMATLLVAIATASAALLACACALLAWRLWRRTRLARRERRRASLALRLCGCS